MIRANAYFLKVPSLGMPSLVRPSLGMLSLVILTTVLLTTAMPTAVGGLFSGVAQAQVATSDLTPGQTLFIDTDRAGINNTSFTPHNPAAIQWAGASKIGIGNIDGASERTDPSGSQNKSHEGGFAGVLFAGESAAFSAAKISAEDFNQGFTKTFESDHVQFSLNLGGTLAAGVGLENATVEDSKEIELLTYGMSLNFDNRLFIGYAQGIREFTGSFPEFSTTLFSGEGDFTKKGVALRTMGGWKWYLEHFILDFQAVENAPGTGIKTTTDALQVNIHGVLIGFSATKVEVEQDPSKPSLEQTVETTTVELGWVPDKGMAFTLRLINLESKGFDPVVPINNFSATIKTASFAVSYLF